MPLIIEVGCGWVSRPVLPSARDAAREVLGATLLGELFAAAFWSVLTMFPDLSMFFLWTLMSVWWSRESSTAWADRLLAGSLAQRADDDDPSPRTIGGGQCGGKGRVRGFRRTHESLHGGDPLRVRDGLSDRSAARRDAHAEMNDAPTAGR